MKTEKLTVRDKSVETFLETMLLSKDQMDPHRRLSPHSLLKDKLIFKKECGVAVGEILKIELFDRSSTSELVNNYTYIAEEYDDLAVKMVLIDFTVALQKPFNSNSN
jgi:hypothetical protein